MYKINELTREETRLVEGDPRYALEVKGGVKEG